MRLLLNLIWLVFGGLVMALGYAIVALVMFVLIITIPFGVASARMALFCLWPFGRTLVRRPDAGAGSTIGNIIWFLLAGWWLAIGHVITGVLMCLTIIGIPLGLANFKLIPVSLTPFGRDIIDIDQARRLGIQPAVAMPVDPSARGPMHY
ncbi:MAG: YccF domain-containing protein [Solirubrobacteraceae bacterium]